jgi:hypothetical protein
MQYAICFPMTMEKDRIFVFTSRFDLVDSRVTISNESPCTDAHEWYLGMNIGSSIDCSAIETTLLCRIRQEQNS